MKKFMGRLLKIMAVVLTVFGLGRLAAFFYQTAFGRPAPESQTHMSGMAKHWQAIKDTISFDHARDLDSAEIIAERRAVHER